MKRIVIAIDGTAASGKGTLAQELANRLELSFLDTGGLYRLAAKQLLDQGRQPEENDIAITIANDIKDSFTPDLLNDPGLRTEDVSQATSKISAIPEVRSALLNLQRDFAKNPPPLESGLAPRGAVLDGRDITTIVCPDADVKLFVTADVEVRAKRRHKELQSKGIPVTYEAVLADMQERDERDASRQTAPMKMADSADLIDTSRLTIEDVLQAALHIVKVRTGFTETL